MIETSTGMITVVDLNLVFSGANIEILTGRLTISAVISSSTGTGASAAIIDTVTADGKDFLVDDMNTEQYWIDSYNAMMAQT